MNVLSLFDGISCGQIALQRAGMPYDNYYASEIDKWAIQITQKNFPGTIQLGDIRNWREWDLPEICLLMGGSPCQGFSYAGKGLNFDDPRSALFFEFVDILQTIKPKYFLLENVRMKKEWQDIITEYLGAEPIEINSALVSAQNRRRLYWTNIPNITQPEDKEILLRDILLPDATEPVMHNLHGGFKEKEHRTFVDKSPTIRTPAGGGHIPSVVITDNLKDFVVKYNRKKGVQEPLDKSLPILRTDRRGLNRNQNQNAVVNIAKLLLSEKEMAYMNRETRDGRTHWDFEHHSDVQHDKSRTVVANFLKGVPYNVLRDNEIIRKFHPIECERLQTLPDNYTEGVSNTQRYKACGNSWTVDVIVHILEGIK